MEKEVRAMLEKGEKVTLVAINECKMQFNKEGLNALVLGKEYKIDSVDGDIFYIKSEIDPSHMFTMECINKYFKLKQPKDPNELIGRKVKGFRFEDTESGIVFPEQMNELIGFKGEILTYPADQIEQHLLPEKKTKKERIEELEKIVSDLQKRVKSLEEEKTITICTDVNNREDGVIEITLKDIEKQAPEFWYVDIVEEKDSELLLDFNIWFLNKTQKALLSYDWRFKGYSGGKFFYGYEFQKNTKHFKNSDKMQKITLKEWNTWFNK
jgi:hypothetical protein